MTRVPSEARVQHAAHPRVLLEEGDHPLVIAETRVDIPEASVGDAVMMLDLRNTNALLFVNSMSGDHNMVYRREDGSIGWVEPRRATANGAAAPAGVAASAK